jgi:hypothetical protein
MNVGCISYIQLKTWESAHVQNAPCYVTRPCQSNLSIALTLLQRLLRFFPRFTLTMFFSFVTLGFELRTSHLKSGHPITWATCLLHFALVNFWRWGLANYLSGSQPPKWLVIQAGLQVWAPSAFLSLFKIFILLSFFNIFTNIWLSRIFFVIILLRVYWT